MRKGILLVGLMLVLVLGVSSVWADDDAPKPGTPADNECNVGGVLYREENQDGCPTLWYWKAGWFLARFNRGFISRADFPKEFESVLPPLEKNENTASSCWPQSPTYSVLYMGPANTLGNVTFYGNDTCTGASYFASNAAVVFANSQPDALAICASLGKVYNLVHLNTVGYATAPANAYGCTVNVGS